MIVPYMILFQEIKTLNPEPEALNPKPSTVSPKFVNSKLLRPLPAHVRDHPLGIPTLRDHLNPGSIQTRVQGPWFRSLGFRV